MSFKVNNIDLSSLELSHNDLLRVKHSIGSIDYVPMYYLNLVCENLKHLLNSSGNNNEHNGSIDFNSYEVEDFFAP